MKSAKVDFKQPFFYAPLFDLCFPEHQTLLLAGTVACPTK